MINTVLLSQGKQKASKNVNCLTWLLEAIVVTTPSIKQTIKQQSDPKGIRLIVDLANDEFCYTYLASILTEKFHFALQIANLVFSFQDCYQTPIAPKLRWQNSLIKVEV
jgi:hypothetical protein